MYLPLFLLLQKMAKLASLVSSLHTPADWLDFYTRKVQLAVIIFRYINGWDTVQQSSTVKRNLNAQLIVAKTTSMTQPHRYRAWLRCTILNPVNRHQNHRL